VRDWQSIPFLKIFIPFVFGIFIAIYVQVCWVYVFGIILVGNAALFIIERITNRRLIAFPYQKAGAIVMACLFCLGFFRVDTFRDINRANHFSKTKAEAYKIRVQEFGVTRFQFHRFRAKVEGVKWENELKHTTGNVLVYWDTALGDIPKLGEQFWIKADFKGIPTPKNPNEFNYKQYLSYYNIYFKTYLKSRKAFVVVESGPPWASNMLNKIRVEVKLIFSRYLKEGSTNKIAQALILGSKSGLDEEVKSYFAQTGTLHVLAVSGLHVGILFLILKSLTGFLKGSKKGQILAAVLVLLGVWLYAVVTGFSASVQRASCMFSLLSIGSLFKGKHNGINSLFASAFIMLAYNPFLIVNVGFQLSYAAVLGIMLIYRPIYMMLNFGFVKSIFIWTLIDKAWAICAISLAAQMATLPISLFYFGQFPTYFLFSNLFVIPAIFILVCLAVILIVTSPFPYIAQGVAWLFSLLSKAVLASVAYVAKLPFSYASGLHLSFWHVIILFLTLGFLTKWLHSKRMFHLNISLLLCVVLLAMVNYKYMVRAKQDKVIVHSVKHHQVVTRIAGNEAMIIADSNFCANESTQKFYLAPYFRANYIKSIHTQVLDAKLVGLSQEEDTIHLLLYQSKYPNLELLRRQDDKYLWLLPRNAFTDTFVVEYQPNLVWTGVNRRLDSMDTPFPRLDSFAFLVK